MARVTHVKKAQQRYRQVPVIDPETGKQKQTPVMRNGVQRANKRGTLTFLRVTEDDRSQPLPPERCDSCNEPIEVGTPYKWVKPKSGPYGGRKRSRHASCPTWKQWELSNSWSARIAQVIEPALDGFVPDSPEEVTSKAEEIAGEIRSLADESRDTASNIEQGFGHPTMQSEEAEERGSNLDSWADDIEQVEVPDLPEPEEDECEECGGTGKATEDVAEGEAEGPDCENCDGTGRFTPEEPTEEQMDEWRDEATSALQDALDQSPL